MSTQPTTKQSAYDRAFADFQATRRIVRAASNVLAEGARASDLEAYQDCSFEYHNPYNDEAVFGVYITNAGEFWAPNGMMGEGDDTFDSLDAAERSMFEGYIWFDSEA